MTMPYRPQREMPKPLIPWWTMGPKEQIFTWQDFNGRQYHFATERIAKKCEEMNYEVVTVAIDPKFAITLPENRGLETHRFNRIPRNPARWTPILLLKLLDGDGLLVDGNHRYYLAFTMGATSIRAYFADYDIWKDYLVDLPELPSDPAKGFSGIL